MYIELQQYGVKPLPPPTIHRNDRPLEPLTVSTGTVDETVNGPVETVNGFNEPLWFSTVPVNGSVNGTS